MKTRASRFWVISILVHAVAFLLIAHSLRVGGRLDRWMRDRGPQEIPAERIGFLALPRGEAAEPGRSGGDGRPVDPAARPAPALVAPAEVPTGLPPVPDEAPSSGAGGSGPVVGRGGPTQGIVPRFDSPIWAPVAPELVAPRSAAEEIREGIAVRLGDHLDSLKRAQPTGRAPGDWTVTKGDRKYGIDQKKIYLGPVEIPTAVLALLPLNVQANPSVLERERALAMQRADIQYQAQRAMTEDEFRQAVKRIRERTERERRREREALGPVAAPAEPR